MTYKTLSIVILMLVVGYMASFSTAYAIDNLLPISGYHTNYSESDFLVINTDIQSCHEGSNWQIAKDPTEIYGSYDYNYTGGSLYFGVGAFPSFDTIYTTYGAGFYYLDSNANSGYLGDCRGYSTWQYGYVSSLGFTSAIFAQASSTPATPTVAIPKNIEILNPTYGTTTATTTFSVTIKYKTGFSLDFRPTTTRHFRIVDAVTGEIDYSYNVTLPANSSENIIISATTTVPEGSKYLRAMYLDENGGLYSELDEVFFNVATNTYKGVYGLDNPRATSTALTQIDCDLFAIGCQFQKALVFLFYPDTGTLDKFSNVWQTIAEKKPFGYVTHTINELKNLDTSGAVAFSLGTVPFMDSIFTPFRTLMAGILWAIYAIYFYRNRLIHLDI